MASLPALGSVAVVGALILLSTFQFMPAPASSPAAPAGVPPTFFGVSVPVSTTSWPPEVPFGTMWKTASGGPPGGTYWAQLEPSNGTFDWAPLDNVIAAAREGGVGSVGYTLYETPAWASSDPAQSCFATDNFGIYGCAAPPKHIGDWDRFVEAVATRYKGEIQYYEVWNEPNVSTEYSGNLTEMVSLAGHAYSIIRSTDPGAKVLAPGVAVAGIRPYSAGCPPSQCWLAEYLQAGGGAYADGIDFHGKTCLSDNAVCVDEGIACPAAEIESCAGSSLVSQVDDVRSLMAANGLSGKLLVDSEGGYSEEVGQKGLWGSADQQAAFASRFFVLQASEDVSVAVYFTWNTNVQKGFVGLGTAAAKPEIDRAYDAVHGWLLNASMVAPCQLSSGVWSCGMTSPLGREELAVFADTNSSAATFTPPAQYAEYRLLNGTTRPISPGAPIPVDEKPVLLTGAAAPTSSYSGGSSATRPSTTTSTLPASSSQSASSRSATFSRSSSSSSSVAGGVPSFPYQPLLAAAVAAAVAVSYALARRTGRRAPAPSRG